MGQIAINQFKSGFKVSDRKFRYFIEEYTGLAVDKIGEITPVVVLRLYKTRTNWYACLWIKWGQSAAGSGKSESYDGMGKAILEAFQSAGIEVTGYNPDSFGLPETLIEDLMDHLGYKTSYVHHSHP